MKRFWIALVFASLAASRAPAATLGELFQQAKGEFAKGQYAETLKTLDALKAESEKPENEKYRSQLAPPLAFYRGATLAALGRSQEARSEFVAYLNFQPNASIDAGTYPKKVVAEFEAARKSFEKSSGGNDTGLAAAYRSFRADSVQRPAEPEWAAGAVRYLMTSTEKASYAGIVDPREKAHFVEEFWRIRDPKPETPENEFRNEFERRVAFADANFAQGEKRGSDTDRGMVFILLGPPTYIGRKPLGTGEDTAPEAGLSTSGRHDAEIAVNNAASGPRVTSGQTAALIDQNRGTTARDASNNWREVWHYRRELLPSGVPYQQVDFEFVTKRGYGENVLQRDSPTLNTIEVAKKGTAPRS